MSLPITVALAVPANVLEELSLAAKEILSAIILSPRAILADAIIIALIAIALVVDAIGELRKTSEFSRSTSVPVLIASALGAVTVRAVGL